MMMLQLSPDHIQELPLAILLLPQIILNPLLRPIDQQEER